MSVIVRDLKKQKIILMTKGADSIIENLLDTDQSDKL
jgi:magnesium-transporting ATPase (P-type)